MSIECKKCGKTDSVKNGIVRGQQRYKCKHCGCNFINIDRRKNDQNTTKRALCVILCSLVKGTYRFLGQIFGVAHTTIYRWILKEAEQLPEPNISNNIRHVEIDEMWHFLHRKKTKNGF